MASKKRRNEAGGPSDAAKNGGGNPAQPKKRRFSTDDRFLRFLLFFGLWLAVFFILATRDVARQQVFPGFLRANAAAAGVILNAVGEDVTVNGSSIRGNKPPRFAIEVARGCDAVEPLALFCSAVLASPVPWLARLIGILAGSLLLVILNFVRVVSLYWIGVHWRKAFDTMHLEVWQVLFILLAIVFWGIWATQVARRSAVASHAPA